LLRRLAFGLLAAGLFSLAAPALAQPPTSTTTTEHGVLDTFVDVIPTCAGGGSLYAITTTSNFVMHETRFDDGRAHGTFAEAGTFSAVPLRDVPSYTGRFTIRGGFNENGSIVNLTSTFNLRATGSDGSTLSYHEDGHFTARPDGSIVTEFFHCH
jgi:hypothetical protein